jgi:hypothetical protein
VSQDNGEELARRVILRTLDWLKVEGDAEGIDIGSGTSGFPPRQVFSAKWRNKYFEVEKKTNQLIEILDLDLTKRAEQTIEIGPIDALGVAQDFLNRFELAQHDASLTGISLNKPPVGRWSWIVAWTHNPILRQAIRVKDETIHVDVDTETQQVLHYHRTLWSHGAIFEPRLSREEAFHRTVMLFEDRFDESTIASIAARLEFVHPNFYWEQRIPLRDDPLLVWVVTIRTLDNIVAEFWIDSMSGDCVGGDRTRR